MLLHTKEHAYNKRDNMHVILCAKAFIYIFLVKIKLGEKN